MRLTSLSLSLSLSRSRQVISVVLATATSLLQTIFRNFVVFSHSLFRKK